MLTLRDPFTEDEVSKSWSLLATFRIYSYAEKVSSKLG